MSAGDDAAHMIEGAASVMRVVSGLEYLAPKFEQAVKAAIAECDALGLDAMVYETYRSDPLAKAYYAKGRTAPGSIVTNAKDNLRSWHGFGLAVDVIHRVKRWDAPASWWPAMAAAFKAHGCAWGGDWHSFKDLPHLQWALCPGSPDEEDRRLLREQGGLLAVWDRHAAI